MVLFDQEALTPAGRLVGVPIPVAPVVAISIGTIDELRQIEGEDDGADAVLAAFTIMEPEALTYPHPPVNGIV